MLLLLLVYHLFQEYANALPITLTDAADSISPSPCLDIRHCRQISDIVIGCVSTVFACTWVSLHNNVPPPGWSARQKWGDRIGLAVIALVLPEVVVVMAGTECFVVMGRGDFFQINAFITWVGKAMGKAYPTAASLASAAPTPAIPADERCEWAFVLSILVSLIGCT
ncbi:hypothetical protein FIBSPDRAFT_968735 [Athelia psychrophila]|uniref:Uncharacterized protein n=1 Tax=Athelia psychrophila TaxID=1759441 RepID=A0A167U9W2_9AGAM|nr:hypothetical protein FIBSPDRAFT_968735 [Fibularhizoctonia sp. CBS 109695]